MVPVTLGNGGYSIFIGKAKAMQCTFFVRLGERGKQEGKGETLFFKSLFRVPRRQISRRPCLLCYTFLFGLLSVFFLSFLSFCVFSLALLPCLFSLPCDFICVVYSCLLLDTMQFQRPRSSGTPLFVVIFFSFFSAFVHSRKLYTRPHYIDECEEETQRDKTNRSYNGNQETENKKSQKNTM